MKQNDTKYHELYLMLQDENIYLPSVEDRNKLLTLIKELYSDNSNLIKKEDDNGKYGIRYKTIGEDSSYSDTKEQFFSSKEKRDKIYDDWVNNCSWDSILNLELEYPTPTPNIHDIVKIFKVKV